MEFGNQNPIEHTESGTQTHRQQKYQGNRETGNIPCGIGEIDQQICHEYRSEVGDSHHGEVDPSCDHTKHDSKTHQPEFRELGSHRLEIQQ